MYFALYHSVVFVIESVNVSVYLCVCLRGQCVCLCEHVYVFGGVCVCL